MKLEIKTSEEILNNNISEEFYKKHWKNKKWVSLESLGDFLLDKIKFYKNNYVSQEDEVIMRTITSIYLVFFEGDKIDELFKNGYINND